MCHFYCCAVEKKVVNTTENHMRSVQLYYDYYYYNSVHRKRIALMIKCLLHLANCASQTNKLHFIPGYFHENEIAVTKYDIHSTSILNIDVNASIHKYTSILYKIFRFYLS